MKSRVHESQTVKRRKKEKNLKLSEEEVTPELEEAYNLSLESFLRFPHGCSRNLPHKARWRLQRSSASETLSLFAAAPVSPPPVQPVKPVPSRKHQRAAASILPNRISSHLGLFDNKVEKYIEYKMISLVMSEKIPPIENLYFVIRFIQISFDVLIFYDKI